jgi:hypothetical protein
VKKIIKKSFYAGVLLFIFSGVISCEKDFTNIGTSIIKNTQFTTGEELFDITIENSPIEKVTSGNISIEPGQYLLGVYNSTDYEKIEASIISQLAINPGLTTINSDTIAKYRTGTTDIVTTIDTVFIKLPYQATLENNTSDGPEYTLDSIIGDQSKSFTLNAYQSGTYLSRLNPTDPSKLNSYSSNDLFVNNSPETKLTAPEDFQFLPSANDTVMFVKRWANNNTLVTIDTIKYTTSTNSAVPLPFAAIPLKEDEFKRLFLDEYGSSHFDSQDAFNDYFRGVILKAEGNEGSLISLNFNNTNAVLNPSVEVYYTNTVIEIATNDTIKTFRKNDSFSLSGIRVASYNMVNNSVNQDEIKVQGTAGSEAKVKILEANQLAELRAKNWLINEASITFYINQDADTTTVPNRLYLYKSAEVQNTNPPQFILSQIKDSYSEPTFGGFLARENKKVNSYTFNITDYISDLLSGETNYNPPLQLKVFNTSDLPETDTIFRQYNWNPKAITLYGNSSTDETKKPRLKISYSEKN